MIRINTPAELVSVAGFAVVPAAVPMGLAGLMTVTFPPDWFFATIKDRAGVESVPIIFFAYFDDCCRLNLQSR